jgi:fibronectin type 3 domain-containing protein
MKQILVKIALVSVIAALLLSGCDGSDGSNSGGSSGGGGSGGNTAVKPSPPRNVTATAQSSSRIRITWEAPSTGPTPAYYNVYRATSLTETPRALTPVSGTKFALIHTGLQPSKKYYYWVEAEDINGNRSDRYGPVSETTYSEDDDDGDGDNPGGVVVQKPGTPTNVTATLPSSNSIQITWTAPSSGGAPDKYNIYRSVISAINGYEKIYSVNSSETSYTDKNLGPGTYFYQVEAENSEGGKGPLSVYVYKTISASSGGGTGNTTKPNPPTSVYASATSSSSITVSWSSVSNADKYYVYSDTSPTGSYAYRGSSTTLSYLDTGLDAGKRYYYKVSSYNNSAGEGSKSTVYDFATTLSSGGGGGTTTTPPSAPTGVKMSLIAPNENGFRISWNSVAGLTYNVYKSLSSSFTSSAPYKINGDYYDDTSVTFTYGNSYYYQVRAVNSSGTESSPSTTVRVTVPKVKVRAYKQADGTVIIASGKLYKGGIKLGSNDPIETDFTSAEAYSAYSSYNPGTYKLSYGFVTKAGSSITYKEKGNVTLKPWHEYTFNSFDGSTKEDKKVTFDYY